MYYAIVYRGSDDTQERCMGFCADADRRDSLIAVLGEGARAEEVEGSFPADLHTAAAAWEAEQRPSSRSGLFRLVAL